MHTEYAVTASHSPWNTRWTDFGFAEFEMRKLIPRIACAPVASPDQVEIFENSLTTGTIFDLKVAKEDVGKVVGKKGQNANALRRVLAASAARKKL